MQVDRQTDMLITIPCTPSGGELITQQPNILRSTSRLPSFTQTENLNMHTNDSSKSDKCETGHTLTTQLDTKWSIWFISTSAYISPLALCWMPFLMQLVQFIWLKTVNELCWIKYPRRLSFSTTTLAEADVK